ncbi:MAG: flagellar biosynthesis protein FlhF [Spirochaetaceae bacterium]|jgi:flagellar biosynthesis protein FlhF|nr:flagellar biosynthesis protein FlhF [Spirochaetaceae bacterium]
MPYFTEQARTYTECMEKIKARYGSGVKVLLEKTVRKGGFLGIGSHEEVEMTGTYGYTAPAPAADLETAKRQVLAAAGKTVPETTMQAVLKELRTLNEKIETKIEAPSRNAEQTLHPALVKLEEDLVQNDFSPAFIKTILDRARREFPLEELDNYEEVQKRVVPWIGERISIYRESGPRPGGPVKKRPRIIVLVGSTGTGKTTTIAKLAAFYGDRTEGIWKKQVRFITLDSYRIGGKQQIEKYGEIMEIPVSSVDSYDMLRQTLSHYHEGVDFVLIDTIGKSPRNLEELGKMKAVLDACPSGRTEVHLCISADVKTSDVRETLKQFEPFKYRAVIITKLDQTGRIGNIISVLAEEGKSISFVTTGQTVPSDIEQALVVRLLMKLDGFTVDRTALADYFSSKDGM